MVCYSVLLCTVIVSVRLEYDRIVFKVDTVGLQNEPNRLIDHAIT